MDDLTNDLRDLGRALEHQPPPSLARQRTRLTDAARAPRRRLRPRGWTALALAACAVAALLLVPAVLLRTGDHSSEKTNGLAGAGRHRAMTLLLLGSDSRGPASDRRFGGARSDTMALVRLPADRKRVTVVSLPRDLLVRLPGCPRSDGGTAPPGPGPLNSAYGQGGVSCAVRTVESVTRVHVDQAVVVDFKGFSRMVDALGGVTVVLPKSVNDQKSGLHMSAGRHKLNGKGALAYARVRHGMGDGSDLSRIKRQQGLMAELSREAIDAMHNDPLRFAAFLKACLGSVKTAPGLDLDGMKALADSLKRTDPSRALYVTLPNKPAASDPNRLEVDEPRASQVLAPFR
ncbi:LCP family protein [Actinomadura rupiterrae]|uniref:LCP family protein n=1 Tax=Actinomadura rupiterrae TaxID=559627 RepID=UPI0020A2FF64|nr:LCP family protein [Actinomadura rupiterrae]MCP2335046.1 LCP family protein required for cell wall assembly [Actinomadura rupiterrae]